MLRFLAGLNQLNCVLSQEIPNCVDADVNLVQWLFEAQSDDVIEHLLGKKTIVFKPSFKMLPLDYYSLGYCISHSQCQWMLGLGAEEIGENEVRMLVAGASTRSEPRSRVLALSGSWSPHLTFALPILTNCLNMLLTEWKSILCLRQLSVELRNPCDHITWPELSALRVVQLVISGEINWKLNTLLPHLSLETLSIAPARPCSLVHEDCVAIGDHITSTTTLKKLLFNDVEDTTCILHISDEEGMEAITAALASNQSLPLETLRLECKCTFTATAGDSLAQFITNTTTLRYLSIKKGRFDRVETIMAALASNINQSLPLERLELECKCTFTATAGDNLAQFITHTTTLKYLSIKKQCFDRVETIMAALASNQSVPLERLVLECKCTFTATAGDSLAQFITNSTTMKHLSVSKCRISAHALLVLAKAIHIEIGQLSLRVSGDNEAKDLAQLLVKYPAFINFCEQDEPMHFSGINDAGAEALAQGLQYNSTVKCLNLSNNSIGDAGAVSLVQALYHNSKSILIILDLSRNRISDAGAVALAQALQHECTLRELNLYGNDEIGEKGTCALLKALTVNKSTWKNGLSLPSRCEEFAKQCPQYNTVKNKIRFSLLMPSPSAL